MVDKLKRLIVLGILAILIGSITYCFYSIRPQRNVSKDEYFEQFLGQTYCLADNTFAVDMALSEVDSGQKSNIILLDVSSIEEAEKNIFSRNLNKNLDIFVFPNGSRFKFYQFWHYPTFIEGGSYHVLIKANKNGGELLVAASQLLLNNDKPPYKSIRTEKFFECK